MSLACLLFSDSKHSAAPGHWELRQLRGMKKNELDVVSALWV